MGRPIVEHIIDDTQICRRCEIPKAIDQFWKSSYKSSGLLQYCKTCANLNRKETRHRQKSGDIKHTFKFNSLDKNTVEYKNHQRNRKLKVTYGITLDDYNKMFSIQSGCCDICKTHQSQLKRPLDVDHNHDTGEVRGLLCSNCNTGIGLLKDSSEILTLAIKYLEKNNKKDSIKLGESNFN